MLKQIILNLTTSEKRAAILEEGQVKELLFARPDSEATVGSIYLGRVTRVVSGMQAAFIDIGKHQNGFIHSKDLFFGGDDKSPLPPITQLVTEGETILVQVKKEATQSKGPLLTKNITIPGSNIVYLPLGNYIAVSKKLDDPSRSSLRDIGRTLVEGIEGLIMRTSSKDMPAEELGKEIGLLRNEWIRLQKKADAANRPILLFEGNSIVERALEHAQDEEVEIVLDDFETYKKLKHSHPELENRLRTYSSQENIFSYFRIDPVIEKLYKPYVWLKNGGHLLIETTETMTVIDVNTGKFTGKHEREKTVLEMNLLAAKEIAHQLRLRNISGMILVDFIRMKNREHQLEVQARLEVELSKDPLMPRVHGYTSLGLMEITRKKMQNIHLYMLSEKCVTCEGTGRIQSVDSAFYSLERELYALRNTDDEGIWLSVSKKLKYFLQNDGAARLAQLRSLTTAELYLTEDVEARLEHYSIKQIGSTAEIENRINRMERF